jgi:hypothetical protein
MLATLVIAHRKLVGATIRFVVIHSFTAAGLPMLVNVVDQGAPGLSALQHLQHMGLNVWTMCDVFHRAWNDLKLALRRSKAFLWRYLLQWCIVFNLPYGPFNSSGWADIIENALEEFMYQVDSQSAYFKAWARLIAEERHVSEPTSPEEYEALKASLVDVVIAWKKGTRAKLSRWFTFFEAETEHVPVSVCTPVLIFDCVFLFPNIAVAEFY